MVAIQIKADEGFFGCGATLVASKYVITAAHCLFCEKDPPIAPTDVEARIGEHNFQATGETSIPTRTMSVSKIICHPKYDERTENNDIAVLQLAEEVDLNVYTPACMAKTSDESSFYGKTAQVYGWGDTSFGGAPSLDKLLEVDVTVVTPKQCAERNGDPSVRFGGKICAGGEVGKDTCQVYKFSSQDSMEAKFAMLVGAHCPHLLSIEPRLTFYLNASIELCYGLYFIDLSRETVEVL